MDSSYCTFGLQPYHVGTTSSRPITEVKQHRAELVGTWMGDRLGKLSAVVQPAVAGKGEVNNSYCNNGVLVYVRLVLQLVTYLKCTCFQLAPPLLSVSNRVFSSNPSLHP